MSPLVSDGIAFTFMEVAPYNSATPPSDAALQEREARLRSILETAPDAIIVIDDHGIMESFNWRSVRSRMNPVNRRRPLTLASPTESSMGKVLPF